MKLVLGLDYGTNSVRAVLVNVENGAELATAIWDYEHGEAGIILDAKDPNVARQHPQDYLRGAEITIKEVLKKAGVQSGADVIGIGVDTTGSTPMPVFKDNRALAMDTRFANNRTAMAWLWKDHTSTAEAETITKVARERKPHYLAKIGGVYSSEWFWAKVWRAKRDDAGVFEAADTWVEIADWIPAQLAGITDVAQVKRGICAAGHKGLFHADWGGYPEEDFLGALDPALVKVRRALPDVAYAANEVAGRLSAEWAKRTGLAAGTPIAVGAFDAHLGGVGSGIKPGTLVKIVGTSTCDMMVAPFKDKVADIPGICGIVPESIIPGHQGLEAGQSAVGDIFNWFVNVLKPGGGDTHESLTRRAEQQAVGEHGLLVLDWHNGNRTVLVDQRLTGMILGLTLHTRPEEIYRALIEATAFGARVIMERFEAFGQKVEQIVNCGGISVKNTLVMQIYADVMNRPMKVSRSTQTPALGAAIAGAVVAGKSAGGYASFEEGMDKMTGTMDTVFHPIPANVAVYERMYKLYKDVHDAFGTETWQGNLFHVMKEMLDIREKARSV